MIEWHTADAWTRAADRHSAAFRRALVLGGFAAPLFLWLAGLGVALSAARLARTFDSRGAVVRTICRRGHASLKTGAFGRAPALPPKP